MQAENSSSSPATFLEIARQRAMLSEDEAKTIQNIADSKEIGSSDAALQKGLMNWRAMFESNGLCMTIRMSNR